MRCEREAGAAREAAAARQHQVPTLGDLLAAANAQVLRMSFCYLYILLEEREHYFIIRETSLGRLKKFNALSLSNEDGFNVLRCKINCINII